MRTDDHEQTSNTEDGSARVEILLPTSVIEAITEEVTRRVVAELQHERRRRWLSIKDAARELGMSEGALRKHLARGGLKSSRVGTRIVVDMAAIEGS